MRVAFFTDSFYPSKNGVATTVESSARELVRQGHEVFVCAPRLGEYKSYNAEPGLSVYWLPSVNSLVYPDLRIGAPTPRLLMAVRRFRPDVIHVHTSMFAGWDGVLIAKLLRKPLVYTFSTFYMDKEGLKVIGINRYQNLVQHTLWTYEKTFCKSAKLVICPTRYVASQLKKQRFSNQLEILPWGVDTDEVIVSEHKKRDLKARYNLKGRVILGAGRLSKEKNWEFLLTSFSYIHRQTKAYTLVIIGGGPQEKRLRDLAEGLGIVHHVRFLGAFDHERIIKEGLFQIADVFAMPSQFETFGMVTLEAMSMGVPVVAVRSKGTADLVSRYGILVDGKETEFGDALLRVLREPATRDHYGRLALDRARQYATPVINGKLVSIYRSIIS